MILVSALGQVLIIGAVIVLFFGVTILNIKTKKPKNIKNEECDACDKKSKCPFILTREDEADGKEDK